MIHKDSATGVWRRQRYGGTGSWLSVHARALGVQGVYGLERGKFSLLSYGCILTSPLRRLIHGYTNPSTFCRYATSFRITIHHTSNGSEVKAPAIRLLFLLDIVSSLPRTHNECPLSA